MKINENYDGDEVDVPPVGVITAILPKDLIPLTNLQIVQRKETENKINITQ
jgi:hypothetical protein